MADKTIGDLTDAGTLDGTERVELQTAGGDSRSTSTQAIADLGGGGGAWTPIGSAVSASGTSMTWTSIPDTYRHLRLGIIGISHNGAPSSFRIQVSTDNGSNFSATLFTFADSVADSESISGSIYIYEYTEDYSSILSLLENLGASPAISNGVAGTHCGASRNTGGINSIRVTSSNANFDAGTLQLYGE